jgi:glycosyltransferase involved in cell wall biosynthesis/spore maturation protein CgeB
MKHCWRVLLLDTKESNPNHYICVAVYRALKRHPNVEWVAKANYGNAVRLARENRANLFLAFDGEGLIRSVCARVAAVCGRSIVWLTEDPYEIHLNHRNRDLFDLVFTNDRGSVHQYGARGRHLPLGADPDIHQLQVRDDRDCRYDVFFAGTAWPNRAAFFDHLRRRHPDLRLKLALPHNDCLPAPQLDLPKSTYSWRTPFHEFVRIANRSRIVLTLHRSFSGSGGGATATTPGPRLFEIALGGGFQLVDGSLKEVKDYFSFDSEIARFHSVDACLEQIHRFLSDPTTRVQMARAAQKRALAEHLYSHRVDFLLSEAEAAKPKTPQPTAPRPTVLFVSHNSACRQPFGGVEVYQRQLAAGLRSRFEFLTYAPLGDASYGLWKTNGRLIQRHKMSTPYNPDVLTCPERESAFAQLLVENEVELIHFQHLLGHTPSLPFISRALGIPSVASAHDYYAVCKHFNLLGFDGKFCHAFDRSMAACDVCLDARDRLAAGSQGRRRAFWGRVLQQFDAIQYNTPGVARSMARVFPQVLDSRQFVCPVPLSRQPSVEARTSTPILKVAAVGNFTVEKGGDVLIRVFNQMREDAVEFHVFGDVRNPYPEIFRALAFPNVVVRGAYEPGDLYRRLADIDVSLHLSIWPETYVMTLSEAWQAGAVPVVSDLGALGERVKHNHNGFKVPPEEPGSVIELLRRLIANPGVLETMRETISSKLWVDMETHSNGLGELYDSMIDDNTLGGRMKIHRDLPLTLRRCGVYLVEPSWPVYLSAVPPSPPNPLRSDVSAKLIRSLKTEGFAGTVRRLASKLRASSGW